MNKQILDESANFIEKNVFTEKKFEFDIVKKTCNIKNKSQSKKTGLDIGVHEIINSPLLHSVAGKCESETQKLIESALEKQLSLVKFNNKKKCMFVGLGNDNLIADSLGNKVLSKVLITRGLINKSKLLTDTCGICPDIYAKTGIETYDIISCIAKIVNPDILIVIDSLATENLDRLAVSFQFSSSITAGSGLGGNNKKICKANIGIDCICIGVPLIYILKQNKGNEEKVMYLAPKDIDYQVKKCSAIIAKSINKIIQSMISEKEIELLL